MRSRQSFRGVAWSVVIAVCAVALAQPSGEGGDASEAPPVPRDVIVVLDDGQRLVGVLVSETETSITLRIGGVNTVLKRQFIDRVTTLRPAIERYRSMRAVIDDSNVEQIILLIDWLRAEQLYEEALAEIELLLEREPMNGRALQLRDLVLEQKLLRDSKREETGRARDAGRDPLPARRPLAMDFPLLSDADLNLLKVYEIDLRNPPRVLIERATIDKLLQRYGGLGMIPSDAESAQRFRSLPAQKHLEAMFDVRARDLYGEVQVLDLPVSLRNFRDDVQSTWLVNSCATTACHGGLDAGSFMLFNRAPTSEASTLTNLVILERHRTADGAPLLDYAHPEQSLLLQLALAPRLSARPHPQVRGWRPVFTSRNARRFQDTIAWMESMITPRPEAPIEYRSPRPEDFDVPLQDAPMPAGSEPDRPEPQER